MRIVSRRKIKPRQKLPPSIKQLVRRWNRKILDSCLQFVCTWCSQQKYRDQVTPVTNKTGLFQRCCTDYMSVDNIEWICVSCSRQIRKGLVPEMAVLNGFNYASIPLQFSVTRLEELLCSARIPFMKIFSRPRGGQYASKGAVVNVPSNIDHTLKILPRPANDNCLLAVDLKRRTTDETTYLSRYIRPKLVHEFAEWLCLQPLYVSEGIIYDSSITMQLELPPNIELESDESDESSEDGEIAGSFDTLLNSRPLMDISLKTVTAPTENFFINASTSKVKILQHLDLNYSFSYTYGHQHDASEVLLSIISAFKSEGQWNFFEISYSDNFTCSLCNVSWRRPETTSALVLSPPRNGQLLQELVVNHSANQAVNVTCPNSTCISERAITTKEPTHIANTVILLIARYMFVAGNRVYSRSEVTIGETIEIGGCDYGVKAAVIHTGSFEYGHYFMS